MVAVVVPLSIVHPVVISRKLSKIERPMANVEVDIADYIVASRSSSRRSPGEIFGFHIQNMFNTASYSKRSQLL